MVKDYLNIASLSLLIIDSSLKYCMHRYSRLECSVRLGVIKNTFDSVFFPTFQVDSGGEGEHGGTGGRARVPSQQPGPPGEQPCAGDGQRPVDAAGERGRRRWKRGRRKRSRQRRRRRNVGQSQSRRAGQLVVAARRCGQPRKQLWCIAAARLPPQVSHGKSNHPHPTHLTFFVTII